MARVLVPGDIGDIVVCKFGGTSCADTQQLRKVADIVESDKRRRYVVVSAFGKRSGVNNDHGCTDLLFLCHQYVKNGFQIEPAFRLVKDRYRQIKAGLQLSMDLERHLLEIEEGILTCRETPDFTASRGEYLMAILVSELLQVPFVDATEVIFFNFNGELDVKRTQSALEDMASRIGQAVIPGYYGVNPDGKIKTFSRGGSDITGAIVAKGVGASLYENWTDVSGLLMADPQVVADPKPIAQVTYTELRELAYSGAKVIHPEAIAPVRKADIALNIRNTNRPDDLGTMIVPDNYSFDDSPLVTGIAGRKNFTVLHFAKEGMNSQLGIGCQLLSILVRHKVNWEHMSTSLDSISIVMPTSELKEDKERHILHDIHNELEPDSVETSADMALIATVGRRMAHRPGISGKLFSALGNEGINVRMINQGSSEINVIIGVKNEDFEKAIRAIYGAFCK